MTDRVSLRIDGGSITLDATGIELTPWFTRRPVQIPWRNVMFVSPIPSVKRNGSEWHTFRGERIAPAELQSALKFYSFEVALNDRDAVLAGTNLVTRMWLRLTVWLKPLYVTDDKPHPTNGCVKLHFQPRWLRRNGSALLAALETIDRYSKFDRLFTVD